MSNLKKYLNVYEFNTDLPGSGEEVKYKGLSTNLIKKLLIFDGEQDPLKEEEILDFILKNVIINENFNINNMYILDRYYLFIKIREATKGSIYQYLHKCSECQKETLQSIDLEKIKVEKPKIKDNKIKILDDKVVLYFKHPKRMKQKEVYKFIPKKLSDKEKKIEIQIADIISYIDKIETPDGEEEINIKELFDFIGDLPEKELDKIREWQDNNYFGVDLKHKNICKNCKKEEETFIPITNFFS